MDQCIESSPNSPIGNTLSFFLQISSQNLKPIPPPSVSNFSKLSEKFSSLIAILYCGQGFGPFCISTSCLIGCIYTALANHVFYFHFICSLYPPNPK